MGEIDAQRAAMCRQRLNVDRHEAISGSETGQSDEREIREVLVVDRIELVFRDEPLEVRNLDRYNALRSQEVGHARDEVVELRHLRQNIVGDDQIGVAMFSDDFSRIRC